MTKPSVKNWMGKPTKKEMIVAGVMSGTSADGINVALVQFSSPQKVASPRKAQSSDFHLLGHAQYPYPKNVRAAVLAAMNATQASVADLARLNFLLGELYAEAVLKTQQRCLRKADLDLIGCHGQTLYHQGQAAAFLGRNISATWQTGEAAILAARTGVPVVSDFRPADMAVGGQGAPLVPYLDYVLFRDTRMRRGVHKYGGHKHGGHRIVQNIGGIANLTSIPAGADARDVIAFDAGPGNMVIDAVTEKLFGQPYDRDGRIAATGTVLEGIVEHILEHSFFQEKPPKTAGREQFGRDFLEAFLYRCGSAQPQDIVATATALTAKSIAHAVRQFVVKKSLLKKSAQGQGCVMILSGGGTKNRTLVAMLANELAPLGIELKFSDDFGLPSEAKEAAAFALLAYETWHRRPSNVPSATGAKRAAVLGKVSYP